MSVEMNLRPNQAAVTEVLEFLLDRAEDPDPVVPRDELARGMDLTARDLASVLDHLAAEDAVDLDGSGVVLTDEGRQMAVTVVRRHRLTECLLRDVIGLDWWKVHHEARRWDGLISDELEERLIDLLGDPGACPHGNPIPGSGNRPRGQTRAVSLTSGIVGPVQVVRISEELENDDHALQMMEQCGFLPGQHAEVKAHAESGAVEVAGSVRDATLPPQVARHTFVVPRDEHG